jgi:hypothetical protein
MKRFILIPLVCALLACRDDKPAATVSSDPLAGITPAPSSDPAISSQFGQTQQGFILCTPKLSILSTGEIIPQEGITAADAEESLEEIRKLPPTNRRDTAIAVLLIQLSKTDPAYARKLLAEWRDGLMSDRMSAAEAIACNLAKQDPEALASFVTTEIPRSLQVGVWGPSLLEIPPDQRLAYLDQIPESAGKLAILADFVADYLRQDPQAAAAWLDELSQELSDDELALLGKSGSYFNHYSEARPVLKSEDWLLTLRAATSPAARAFLARQALAAAGDAPPASLLTELSDVDPSIADLVRDAAIQRDPAVYAASLDQPAVAALSSEQVGQLVSAWAERQPRPAFDWAVEQGRPEAAKAMLSLYDQEPQEALALLPSLPSGTHRDEALRSICARASHARKKDLALGLLQYFSDPALKERTRLFIEDITSR